MKDGYNSAHRYYLNVFRDSYRQVIIGKPHPLLNLSLTLHCLSTDLMQGVNPFEAFMSLPRSLQGMDELDDGLLQSTSSVEPVRVAAWSLERETVSLDQFHSLQSWLLKNLYLSS